jgi:hypothetical protein
MLARMQKGRPVRAGDSWHPSSSGKMKVITRFVLWILAALWVVGCGNGHSDSPETAKGDTRIRYVICSMGGTGCFVAARFKDIDGCESHKKWAEMLCDSQSNPGKMVCTRDTGTAVSVSYCTL